MAPSAGLDLDSEDGDALDLAWRSVLSTREACCAAVKEADGLRRSLRSLEEERSRLLRDSDAHAELERSLREGMERAQELVGGLHETRTGGTPDKRTALLNTLRHDRGRLDDAHRSLVNARALLADLDGRLVASRRALAERMDRLAGHAKRLNEDIAFISANDRGDRRAFRLQLARQTLDDIRAVLGAER
jgi:hypothetical protein